MCKARFPCILKNQSLLCRLDVLAAVLLVDKHVDAMPTRSVSALLNQLFPCIQNSCQVSCATLNVKGRIYYDLQQTALLPGDACCQNMRSTLWGKHDLDLVLSIYLLIH